MTVFDLPGLDAFAVLRRILGVLLVLLMPLSRLKAADVGERLRIVATTPDIESIVRSIGSNRVDVVALSSGPEDPHQVEIKPGHVKSLNRAELFIQVGLGIENAWLKDLMQGAKNAAIQAGKPGRLNLGLGTRLPEGIERSGVPGSYHEEGNPHYLLDPVEGLRSAREILGRLVQLRPAWKAEFDANHASFRQRLAIALAGEECAKDADLEQVVVELESVTGAALEAFRTRHQLGGWLAEFLAYRGRTVVGDHDLWPYFARRFGLEIVGYLEPSPGSPPTTKHLSGIVEQARARKTGIILSAPYFDTKHAEFVAKRSEAKIVPMAHQTGGRPGVSDYTSMVRFNVESVLRSLRAPATSGKP